MSTRLKILLVFQLLFNTPLFSQSLSYFDDYSSDRSDWRTYTDENSCALVENGMLVLTPDSTNNGCLITNDINYSWKDKNEISFKIKQLSGTSNYAYGIIWGVKSGYKQYEQLKIFSTGFVQYNRKVEDEQDLSLKYRCQAISALGDWNEIKVIRDQAITILVNRDTAAVIDKKPTCGPAIGFYTEKNIKIAIDELKIQTTDKEIEVYKPFRNIIPVQLDSNINSQWDELSPVVDATGDRIYFLRRGDPSNMGTDNADDIWCAQRNESKSWDEALNLGKPLNNEGYNFVLSTCQNGKVLYLANTYNSDGSPGDVGVSRSEWVNGNWTIPRKVEIEGYYSNSIYTSFFISDDEKVMLLGLQRKGGYGSRDLYVSFQEEGSWSRPLNLGADINTAGKELSPFLAADGRTLFFSSDGFPGYGDNDLFISKRMDDSWVRWSQPLNLGETINTSNWDAYLSVPSEANELFLVRNEAGSGSDIYWATIPNRDILSPILEIKGTLTAENGNDFLEGQVVIKPMNGQRSKSCMSSEKGDYKVSVDYANTYFLDAHVEGYFSRSDTVTFSSRSGFQLIEHDFVLKKIEKGSSFLLNGIYFEQESDLLLPGSEFEIQKLITLLKEYPKSVIRLEGHTEPGNSRHLMELSQARVEAVKAKLVSKGISSKRIKTKAFGGSQPVTVIGAQIHENRRVEFRILKL